MGNGDIGCAQGVSKNTFFCPNLFLSQECVQIYVRMLLVNFQSFRTQFASRPAILIIQRKFLKIQRKNQLLTILNIFALKQIIFNVLRIGLLSLGDNASLDTHIDIFMLNLTQMPGMSNMPFMSFMTKMTHLAYDMCHS